MGLKWSRTMNMMAMPLKNAVKTERFLIKHNIIKPVTNDEEDKIKDSWTIRSSLSETRFIRRYALGCEKNVKGAGNAVFEMLKDVFLVFPTIESEDNGIIIRCKANSIRELTGFKINFWIKITDEKNKIRVEYFVPFNEAVEMQLGFYKAISGTPTGVVGAGFNIISSIMRTDIPKEIDCTIKKYFNT